MTSIRFSLLALLLAIASPAPAAFAQDVAASGIPGITEADLSADTWVARLTNPDKVVLDPAAIAVLNDRIARLDPSVYDIRHLPATLPRAQVRAWIMKRSTHPSRPLVDIDGHAVDTAALDRLVASVAIEAIPEQVTPRYGMAVRRTALRSFPTDLRVFSHGGDTDIDRFQESALFPGD